MIRFCSLTILLILVCGPATSPARGQGKDVIAKMDKGKVEFTIQGEPAGTYIYEGVSKPIVWPVLAPGNIPVTRAWPMGKTQAGRSRDHPHQQSLWFCHGDVIPKGLDLTFKIRGIQGVDFWSVAPGHGKIVCVDVKPVASGANSARINTVNEWRTADGVKILDEKRGITLYDFGKARLWVFDIDLSAPTYPIVFGDTKEGAMGVRVADAITETKGNGMLQNAQGSRRERECWGQHSAWCDYSGTIDGKRVGIAIFDDSKNVLPSCWHARGYGLMAANPFGRKESQFPAVKGRTDLMELAKGQHLRLRYGVLVHQEGADNGGVAGYYKRFEELRGK
jgi:hypothetical protein